MARVSSSNTREHRRAGVHLKLRLSELRALLDDSEAFSATAEAAGARPAPGLRTALQQQCKAYLETLHTRTMNHLNGTHAYDWIFTSPGSLHSTDLTELKRFENVVLLLCTGLVEGCTTKCSIQARDFILEHGVGIFPLKSYGGVIALYP